MCLYSKLIKNPKYRKNKKNGGIIPAISDERVKYVPIGCGKCIECRGKKTREWQTRLHEEIKHNKHAKFITLTFSNESITELCEAVNKEREIELEGYPLDNEIATKAIRLFLERWRKKYKKSVRHWLITELGHNGTENIHLHGVIWTHENYETIAKIWNYGYIWPRKDQRRKTWVNGQTVNYIIKYINKVDFKHKNYTSKILCSPGIGKEYTKSYNAKLNKFNGDKTDEAYRLPNGRKSALPIYYRNKIYSEKEREELWLKKLDENVRYVCGEKINANNEKAYYSLLRYHRIRNTKLGYGDDEKNWNQQVYETERRKLLMGKRMKKVKGEKFNYEKIVDGMGNKKDGWEPCEIQF